MPTGPLPPATCRAAAPIIHSRAARERATRHSLVVSLERAGVLVVAGGAVALIERRKDGEHYFVAPGGGIEPGETPESAAVREAAEELGLAVRLLSKAGVLDVAARGGGRQHYWFADCDSWEFGPMTGPESDGPHNSYRRVWVSLDRLQDLDLRPPDLRSLLEHASG